MIKVATMRITSSYNQERERRTTLIIKITTTIRKITNNYS